MLNYGRNYLIDNAVHANATLSDELKEFYDCIASNAGKVTTYPIFTDADGVVIGPAQSCIFDFDFTGVVKYDSFDARSAPEAIEASANINATEVPNDSGDGQFENPPILDWSEGIDLEFSRGEDSVIELDAASDPHLSAEDMYWLTNAQFPDNQVEPVADYECPPDTDMVEESLYWFLNAQFPDNHVEPINSATTNGALTLTDVLDSTDEVPAGNIDIVVDSTAAMLGDLGQLNIAPQVDILI
ncbi:MAG: hypothetical protein OIF38_17695 [Cellvibrionaceae bacterium]|nr:hypothetical protein [Cellvibrionaceae bacterium]